MSGQEDIQPTPPIRSQEEIEELLKQVFVGSIISNKDGKQYEIVELPNEKNGNNYMFAPVGKPKLRDELSTEALTDILNSPDNTLIPLKAKGEEIEQSAAPEALTLEQELESVQKLLAEKRAALKRVEEIVRDIKRNPFKYFVLDRMPDQIFLTVFGKKKEDIYLEDIDKVVGIYGEQPIGINFDTRETLSPEKAQQYRGQLVLEFESEKSLEEKVKAIESALAAVDAVLVKTLKENNIDTNKLLSSKILEKIKNLPKNTKEKEEVLENTIILSIPQIIKIFDNISDRMKLPAFAFEVVLEKLLNASGLKDISPARDSIFDEAECDEVGRAFGSRGSVIRVTERGYKYKGKIIIRPKVVVGRG